MRVFAFEPVGAGGSLVAVDVDIRRGIPALDLVGQADWPVREARERVRAAARNAGFEFPLDRILVSLSPASLRKEFGSYDLPVALAILGESGALPDPGRPFLAMGELGLDGDIRPARGALAAALAARQAGIELFIVPEANRAEVELAELGLAYPARGLSQLPEILLAMRRGEAPAAAATVDGSSGSAVGAPRPRDASRGEPPGDFAELRGLARVKRALEIAAAGGHNILLFGPPGSGKTMAAARFPSLLPPLDREQSLEVSAIHSLAAPAGTDFALVTRPPFRRPHHGASLEGLVGGGRRPRPGEASLAHHGTLFLDEAMEFRRDALQALREPLESGWISVARASSLVRFPADFQLLLAANTCPCGNLGRPDQVCLCSSAAVKAYWAKLGAPLLDRIDLRAPVRPASASELRGPSGESSAEIAARVAEARAIQAGRYAGKGYRLNARLPVSELDGACPLDPGAKKALEACARELGFSARAVHSVLRCARSIADLRGAELIGEEDLLEAAQHRRLGERDWYWGVPLG